MENDGYNSAVEDFQDAEYPMLQGKTYLDHAGTTVYAKSLVDTFARDLTSNLYGNPHLGYGPAKVLNQVVDDTRERALRFFGADPEHFDLVFVANTAAAIRLITECFKSLSSAGPITDGEGFWYGYHVDSHYSAIGIRECADNEFHLFRSDKEVDQWLTGSLSLNPRHKLGLFAYPGQSNMTGRRLPQRWPVLLRRASNASQRDTYSLLDAADLATTYPLHTIFKDTHEAPDFTAVSFYKIFGFPDLGGLIIRKASGNILQYQKYVGGGTLSLIKAPETSLGQDSRGARSESLEDGTLPVHGIIALDAAISTHERLYGIEPMLTIGRHTNYLIKRLYDSMSALHHTNGIPICKIYKSHRSAYGDSATQGATVSFNLIRADGTYVTSSSAVEKLADENSIFVRAGQLFNPSDIATQLGYDKWRNERLPSTNGYRLGDPEIGGIEVFQGRPTGVVRVSLGAMTTLENIETLVDFLREEFIRPVVPDKSPMRQSQIQSLMPMEEAETQIVPLVAREIDTQVFPQMARGRDSQLVKTNGRQVETQLVPLKARERDTQPLPPLPQKHEIQLRPSTSQEREIQRRLSTSRGREMQLRPLTSRGSEIQLRPSMSRERGFPLRSSSTRGREIQLRPSTPLESDVQLRPSTSRERDSQPRPLTLRDRRIQPLSSIPRARSTPPVPPMPRDRDGQFSPPMIQERETQQMSLRASPRDSPRSSPRPTQMVPIMVQEKPRPHISKLVEEFSTNLEDEILSGHLPVDFSTYQPYELVPGRYSISAPKKHVEFSLPYDDTDSDSMIYPHAMPIPLRQGSYRTIEPINQRKEPKGRFRAFFTSKDKGPVATVAIPRKSVNSYDFILM